MADSHSKTRPLLVCNGYVVPGAHRAHLDCADILIDGSRIAAIGPDLGSDEAVARRNPLVIDARKRIVIPGFINAHTHSNESFCQGFWDALPLEVWILHEYPPFALEPLPERAHYLRTMLLAVECLRSGITTVQDDLINRLAEPAAFDGSAAAYRDIGLRAAITTSMSDRAFLDAPAVDRRAHGPRHQGGARDPADALQPRPDGDVRAQLRAMARRRRRANPRHSRSGRSAMVHRTSCCRRRPRFRSRAGFRSIPTRWSRSCRRCRRS